MPDFSDLAEESAAPWQPVPDEVAYRHCRENITSLLRTRPKAADRPVPACPDWTVVGLVAHLYEVCRATRDSLGGLSAPRPADGASIDELLDGWTRTALEVEGLLAASDRWHGPLMLDVFAHELDIRRILDEPVPVDHPAYPGAMNVAFGGFSRSVRELQLPAIRVEAPGSHWVAGVGEPVVTVTGNRYDLFRSATGRRSQEQIAELSWSAPCGVWLPAFTWGPFRPPPEATEPALDPKR